MIIQRTALAALVPFRLPALLRPLSATAWRGSDGTSHLPPAPNAGPGPSSTSSTLHTIDELSSMVGSDTIAKTTPVPETRSSGSEIDSLLAGLMSHRAKTPPRRESSFLPTDLGSHVMPMLEVREIIPKMGPTAGRSVLVTGDVAQAFSRLGFIVRQNKVKSDSFMQRFHERPGLKRKRLKSQRHRKRFKEGFKKMVSIVQDMRRKGM